MKDELNGLLHEGYFVKCSCKSILINGKWIEKEDDKYNSYKQQSNGEETTEMCPRCLYKLERELIERRRKARTEMIPLSLHQ